MAGNADISAILAALAQRPGGTPTDGNRGPSNPPQPSSAGYPPPPTPGAPANPLGAMPLPQPSNSGSLDLSAIKPVSTGSVSLADAIAKAREKAQTRQDPRNASRGYPQTRSRSRSPPRRDTFRDNYNPYRDERRDDRGRGTSGRERSFSPQRRGYSPPPSRGGAGAGGGGGFDRVRSPPSRPEDNSEVITVASSDVGLIIGRAGENLRRVEAETGARVQFLSGPENAGPLRQCRISGTPRQRADAKNDIFRVAQENPNGTGNQKYGASASPVSKTSIEAQREADKSLQIMVPDKTVGLIIGRGGETIRDLQERSGCHVNITAENKSVNGLRPVNLIGSAQSQARAKDLIMEVVQSDTRGSDGDGPPQRDVNNGSRGYDSYGSAAQYDPYAAAAAAVAGGGGSSKINDTVVVPSEAVGMIIGKGGETIKEMQNASGCKINVSPPSGADINREIGLIGTRNAIDQAKAAIYEKVNAVREKQGGRTRADPGSSYNDPYSQQQTASYGQTTPSVPQAQGVPAAAAPDGQAGGDPYAAYGGYQNYVALWYAAIANQQGGQGAPPPS